MEIPPNIAFIDLAAQQDYLKAKIDAGIAKVLKHGRYIMGPEVAELEEKLSQFTAIAETVSCSNGTDAITLPLMAYGFGPGDAIFAPSFTFAATAEVIALRGATPVFVDVDPHTYNIDPDHLMATIAQVRAEGTLSPKAIIAVDLFGQIADYPALREIADSEGLKLISDAAQGLGSTLNGEHAGKWADVVTASFFPAKPLGCYGDGGAVLTNDEELADIMRSLRVHGKGSDKYDNVRVGVNARLDTLQAAILLEKLAVFPEEIIKRNKIADRYAKGLSGVVGVPIIMEGAVSTWAQYTVVSAERDAIMASLKEMNVPSVIYYAKPLHQQTAYKHYPVGGGGLPVTERLAGQVFSLPMHPYLGDNVQEYIISSVKSAADAAGV